jgi:hypothetical protein
MNTRNANAKNVPVHTGVKAGDKGEGGKGKGKGKGHGKGHGKGKDY